MPEYAVPEEKGQLEKGGIEIIGPGWANELSIDDIPKLNELDVDGSKALFLSLGNGKYVVIPGQDFHRVGSGYSSELGVNYVRYRYTFYNKSSGRLETGYLIVYADGYIELELKGQTYSYRPKEENGEWTLGAYDVSLEGTGADSLKVPNVLRIGFVTSPQQDNIIFSIGKELKNFVPTFTNQEEKG